MSDISTEGNTHFNPSLSRLFKALSILRRALSARSLIFMFYAMRVQQRMCKWLERVWISSIPFHVYLYSTFKKPRFTKCWTRHNNIKAHIKHINQHTIIQFSCWGKSLGIQISFKTRFKRFEGWGQFDLWRKLIPQFRGCRWESAVTPGF